MDPLVPLRDILKEIEFLHSVRARATFDQFKASSADVRAISYSVLVISEAVRNIPEDWLERHPATPWQAIRHEYHGISDVILWGKNTLTHGKRPSK